MNKQFLIIVTVIVAALIGVFIFTSKDESDPNGSQSGNTSNHTQGAGNKKVTLTEYGDFQCPACGQYYPILKEVKKFYGDDIKFEFKHFPLIQIHPNAFAAHRAAEAAGLQGKFFEMHDLLYENQQSWVSQSNPNSVFESFATQLGLDINKFKTDSASEAVSNTINADIKAGQALGANSTPTFLINGEKIDSPKDVAGFKELIDQAIKEANGQ